MRIDTALTTIAKIDLERLVVFITCLYEMWPWWLTTTDREQGV